MESIRVDIGLKRIAINDDPNRVISFNPSDLLFAEKFYAMLKEVRKLLVEIERKTAEFDKQNIDDIYITDDIEFPAVIDEAIEFHKQSCEKMFVEIDKLFGEGTSEMVFQGVYALEVVAQFLDGITPFITVKRAEKVDKYMKRRSSK